jgi:hypothetical protein
MSTKMASFYAAYVDAYFPAIVKDTLSRRLDKIQKAADILKAKYAETSNPVLKAKLEKLRSQLACNLNFSFGPNFRQVNEFPMGNFADATVHSEAPNKQNKNSDKTSKTFR